MPPTPEQEWEYWDTKGTELRHGQLDTVQKAAANWTALFGASLGIFGTVAFAGGLTTVDALADPWEVIVKVATTVAVLLALVATYFGAKASQALSPKQASSLDATALMQRAEAAAHESLASLKVAKVTGTAAAALVLLGSATVLWLGQDQKPAEPPTAVVVVEGKSACGQLTKAVDGSLVVGGLTLNGAVSEFTVVSRCP
ncbi:MAG: hypothetical protein LC808_03575 [Actinobacteria bacterium]|nr:hypothetical protein [Actinomycetota bacterium]